MVIGVPKEIKNRVTNMPGGVPKTSTFALTNATLPFVLQLANKGYRQALLDNEHLRNGLNIAFFSALDLLR